MRRSRARFLLLLGVVLLVPLGLGLWSGWRRAQLQALHIAPEFLSLGLIRTGEPVVHRVAVSNVSNRLVEVARIEASCGCTEVEPDHLVIPPGPAERGA